MIRNSRRIRVRSVVARGTSVGAVAPSASVVAVAAGAAASAVTAVTLLLMLSLLAVTAPSACLAASGEGAGTGRGAQDPGLVQATQDMLAPVIEIVSPAHGGVTSDRSPAIVVRYVDPDSGVDPDTVVLVLDKADVTRWADIGAEEARYTPRPPLKDGRHTVELAVADRAGNVARATWEFTVAGAPPLHEGTEIM
ncbi:MAG: Ig-like domain-containing protein, partial [Bacillota bacterium]